MIDDLLTDAQFYALSLLGGRIYGMDFNKKIPKVYEKRRKERIKVIKGKGRPQGKSLSQEELDNFIQQVENAFRELESKKQKITPTAVAKKLYVRHSGAVQQLKRFFERYNFVTFEEILENYRNQKKD